MFQCVRLKLDFLLSILSDIILVFNGSFDIELNLSTLCSFHFQYFLFVTFISHSKNYSAPCEISFCHVYVQTEVAIDLKQRYVGHCNVGTDIKQASFLGQQGTLHAS
ncbi:uncharacterized protein A4U43_C03F18840 [Asparagus officinalis]|uniref:Uncharacterized protein n=1 Tax=Asparagus officinalis TaxID=4686 RepID=A0A5P1FC61_ASPOF|nr:uncharacterized protein A4U43_C03F18840 [Asparagus officinalis]